ncbi:MAG TPA: LuxR C-terminal-related transcriptional regulator [bacterium]|nr:LuxR C-terminal-related transcriptional regulator [bacterium]
MSVGLPPRPHALVGREKELKAAKALIVRGDVHLVTVTGPPGVGKTRFAVELAAAVAPEFDDGVVFVDLAPVRDPGLVLGAVAQALGVADHPGRSTLERLHGHLHHLRLLILLDNLEQVIAAAGDVAGLLAAAPHLTMLVTSRQPLHVRWEHRYELRPLDLPAAGVPVDARTLARSPATALFLERARAAAPGFSVDPAAPVIAEICRRLDALPLAIELAAAWVGMVGVEAILSRLLEGQSIPLSVSRDAPERQRTLVGAVAWSYDLLNDAERRVFRALGACAGETPLEAVDAVCAGLGVDVLAPVAGLVDKNLLGRVGDGAPQFRMLETIREFAEERLELAGEAEAVRRRHAAWCLDLAQRAERFIWSEQQGAWLERLERAHENVRAALRWCLGGGDAEMGALLAAAMHRFWFARGYMREGRRWCEAAAASQGGISPTAHALTLRNLAFFLRHAGEIGQAVRLAEQAASVAGPVGEPSLTAWILLGLAQAVDATGNSKRSEGLYQQMLETARRAGDRTMTARALASLGSVLRIRGDLPAARTALEEALAIARPLQDKWLTSLVTGNLGLILPSDDPAQATALVEESLSLCHDIGHRWLTAQRLEDLAGLIAGSDRAEVAARLLGAAESLREKLGSIRGPAQGAAVDRAAAAGRERLGPTRFEAARRDGAAMTPDQAVVLALGRSAPTAEEHSPRPGGLTARELEIARAISRGLTNRQIADDLGVSERTVDAHVQNIRNKLGMERRTQIASWASTHPRTDASA